MLSINLKNRAISQTTLPFTSATMFGDVPLATTPSGLVRINGYNDAGVQIPILIKSGTFDLGSFSEKRLRYVYFGIRSYSTLTLSVYYKDNVAGTINIPSTNGELKEFRVPVSRQYQGTYWSWQITGNDFFALYSIRALVFILHPGRRA